MEEFLGISIVSAFHTKERISNEYRTWISNGVDACKQTNSEWAKPDPTDARHYCLPGCHERQTRWVSRAAKRLRCGTPGVHCAHWPLLNNQPSINDETLHWQTATFLIATWIAAGNMFTVQFLFCFSRCRNTSLKYTLCPKINCHRFDF